MNSQFDGQSNGTGAGTAVRVSSTTRPGSGRVVPAHADALTHHQDEVKDTEAAEEEAKDEDEADDARELAPSETRKRQPTTTRPTTTTRAPKLVSVSCC